MINIFYEGGIGDSLMLSCPCREIKKRTSEEVGVTIKSRHVEVLMNNKDINYLGYIGSRMDRYLRILKKPVHPNYLINYDHFKDLRDPLKEHVLIHMCKAVGITGEIEIRPHYYFGGNRKKKIFDRYICIQSSGIDSGGFSPLKEWYIKRFDEVGRWIKEEYGIKIAQVGSKFDPPIFCDFDLRGKTNITELAEVLSFAELFVGLEGFPMHLSRAVETRSVIIYGGRLKSWQIGYVCNTNIETGCPNFRYDKKGCWRTFLCDYGKICMEEISVDMVKEGIRAAFRKRNIPLETERKTI